jgi:MFS family permease
MACEAAVVPYAHVTQHSTSIALLAAAPALAIAMGGLLLSRDGGDAALLARAARVSVLGALAGAVLLGLPLGVAGALAGFVAVGVPCAATPMLLTVAVRNTPREYLASVVATVQAGLMIASIGGAVLGGALATTLGVRAGCAAAMLTVAVYPLVVLGQPVFRRSRLPVPSPPVRSTP